MSADTKKETIVFIEDDPGILDAMCMILSDPNLEIHAFPSYREYLSMAPKLTPDLFILDKQLSGIDGLDVCRILKGAAETREIPVIMISASPQVAKIAMLAGASAFIEKPFEMRKFREIVRRFLR